MRKLQNILIITTTIILIMSTILVGSPIQDNVETVKCLLAFVAVFYIIIKLKNKTPIITNKLDIFVIILMFSCYIPLILKTYASLEDTIVNILTYTSLVSIYFIGKEIEEKNIKTIRNVLIISGIIFFIIGIDNLTTNISRDFLSDFGVLQYRNGEERLISNLGYANSIGIIFAGVYLISINTFSKEKNQNFAVILGSTSFVFLSGLILSESKGSILLLGIIYIIYYLLNKEKSKTIIITITSLISTFLYCFIFYKFKNNEFIIWSSLISIYLTNIILLHFSKKVTKTLEKIIAKMNVKKMIFLVIILILISIIIFTILLQFTSPLHLFKTKTEKGTRQVIRNIDGNSTYKICFDLEAKTNIQSDQIYGISIDEENKYDQVVSTYNIYIGNYKGTKEVNIFTSADTNRITIRYNKLVEDNCGELTINRLTLNEKEIPVDYKFIPMKLVNNIQSLTINNKNTWERGVFIIDGIKLSCKNWLTGIGGNGWEHCYKAIQSYSYDARYSHCYLTKVWIENGILGLMAIIGIIAIILKTLIQNRKKQSSIIIGLVLMLILLHSMIDFDMEFYCIQLFVFLGLGLISQYYINQKVLDYKKGNKEIDLYNIKINEIISIILIIIVSLSGIESGKIVFANSRIGNADEIELDKLEKILPYSLKIKEKQLKTSNLDKKVEILEKIKTIEKYYDNITWYMQMSEIGIAKRESGEEEKGINYLNKAIEIYNEKEFIYRLDINMYKLSCKEIESICAKLENKVSNKDIIIKNYKTMLKIIEEFEKNIKNYEITRKSKMEYTEIKMILERYKENAEKYIQQNQ